MSDTAARPVRVLVYGSCVGRDTIAFAAPERVDLRGYIARQSLISVGSDATAHLPEQLTVSSQFQERMIRDDFAGDLYHRLEALAPAIDVLLWDLADERHGVHRFAEGTVVTRSVDNIRIPELDEVLGRAEHIPFGTPEHLGLWSDRAAVFQERLRTLGILERTVVLEVPWALFTTEGQPSPWSMGIRPKDANERYAAYYDLLRDHGFSMVALPQEAVLADPRHRWGLAPFHYTSSVYAQVLRQLRDDHGFEALAGAAESVDGGQREVRGAASPQA